MCVHVCVLCFPAESFFLPCLLFFFSAGSVLGTGLVKITPAVLALGSSSWHTSQNYCLLIPALLAGRATVQGPEPSLGKEGRWAGILTR